MLYILLYCFTQFQLIIYTVRTWQHILYHCFQNSIYIYLSSSTMKSVASLLVLAAASSHPALPRLQPTDQPPLSHDHPPCITVSDQTHFVAARRARRRSGHHRLRQRRRISLCRRIPRPRLQRGHLRRQGLLHRHRSLICETFQRQCILH